MSEDKKAAGSLAAAFGKHQEREQQPILVAPTTTLETNTVPVGLFPIACGRLNDIRFKFDSSFIKPETGGELRPLSGLRLQHTDAVLFIFGHGDPVGNDVYNKIISARGATAMFGMLTRDVKLWETLYGSIFGNDVEIEVSSVSARYRRIPSGNARRHYGSQHQPRYWRLRSVEVSPSQREEQRQDAGEAV